VAVDMLLPNTRWLTLTNVLLGVVVVLCLLLVAVGVLCDVISKLRRFRSYERELDRDMEKAFGPQPAALSPDSRRGVLGRFCSCLTRARTALAEFLQHAIRNRRHLHGHFRR
jgi:hypothetical protein